MVRRFWCGDRFRVARLWCITRIIVFVWLEMVILDCSSILAIGFEDSQFVVRKTERKIHLGIKLLVNIVE
jgi:hypothetical protein